MLPTRSSVWQYKNGILSERNTNCGWVGLNFSSSHCCHQRQRATRTIVAGDRSLGREHQHTLIKMYSSHGRLISLQWTPHQVYRVKRLGSLVFFGILLTLAVGYFFSLKWPLCQWKSLCFPPLHSKGLWKIEGSDSTGNISKLLLVTEKTNRFRIVFVTWFYMKQIWNSH